MTPNPNQIIYNPGRLVVNPTNLGAFPCGGTALGIVKAVALVGRMPVSWITAEEYGGERVEGVAQGEAWSLTCILRDFDNDAVSRVFGSGVAGVVTYPGAARAGRLLSASAVKLLFVPNAPLAHPAVIIYRAIPRPDEACMMAHSRAAEFGIPLAFTAIRDGAAPPKVYQQGLLASLSIA